MTHKEEMKWLKENDPITYSELTSDPTGVGDSDDIGCSMFFFIIAVVFAAGFLIYK